MDFSIFRRRFLHQKGILVFLIIAALSIFGAFYFDEKFQAWVASLRVTHLEAVIFTKLSKWGDWPQLIGATALAALIARGLGSAVWTKILVTAIVSAALTGLVATTSRTLTGRVRPYAESTITPGWYGPCHKGRSLIGVHAYNAFPSGHTATAVGLASVILFSRPLWGIPCMLIALAIAASRLYLAQHHLSDVVVSLFLGLAIGWCSWQFAKSKGPWVPSDESVTRSGD